MAEDAPEDEEKTEEPSARRLEKAREDGDVPRSQELGAAAVMICSMSALYFFGGWLISHLSILFASGFVIERRDIYSENLGLVHFSEIALESFILIVPFLLLTAVVAVLATSMMGGLNFSLKAIAPKASKFNIISGIKRMFGVKALVELTKSLLKFTLVAAALAYFVYDFSDELVSLAAMSIEPALETAGDMIGLTTILVTTMLVVIAAIDVPFQSYQFVKKMRMTKQELKDEYKDIEGRPEVKAQIRRKQREMAEQRMMQGIKDADVIITNPEHFSVALVYDPESDGAPIVVAKGIDHLALRIRNEAKEHGIVQVQIPPLARAIYFTTEIDQTIPEDLYYAVAQVIAYVFSLASLRRDGQTAGKPSPEIPAGFRFDADGNPE
ncbi:flagellar biosynthesis protein FlhB [Litorivicinus sp.]|nr:flagellar biosynthesis protein FlhB [Litorivicinus sp.]MDB9862099.1 flagellar biosynthesis protein FlhB [Litorivicinus sp.]MDC1208256.1 flagellar biosynthesis protein FlhB [Litorivicinus sp.]MDC1240944.1 flagellar biosynthesis protein FlhB [Litorivicinus sp.]MDC1466113.1 flagellar biosynthesis protein FlhB [Litorivicinus sp.]